MENRKTTLSYDLYQQFSAYKSPDDSNLENYIGESQDFYNGKQYPNKNFNNMIRVTLNICSFSAILKASKICGTPIYLAYTADNEEVDCNALRRFDEYNCSKMKMKSSNFQAALNGFVNGTEITFVRWDDNDTTYKGIYKGGLIEEHIDPRHFAIANPNIQEIQNQDWVMFDGFYSVASLKNALEYDNEEEKRELCAALLDDSDNSGDNEVVNTALCQLFTRFFRINGEVYFECSTKHVNLFKYPHPLSKTLSQKAIKSKVEEYLDKLDEERLEDSNGEKVLDYEIDHDDVVPSVSKDKYSEKEYQENNEKFYLYPFAVFRPFMRNGSFYGRSDIKQIIPVQKAINSAISMNLQCAQNNAYNKIIVKPDALQGQKITNEPGQVLTDFSGFQNTWGIKFAESQPMPNGLIEFTERLLSMTRLIYGFNEVMDGSVTNQDMSGYMLQQMIKQSNTSIEQQQQLFWTYNEEKAAIRLMYYKHYVDKAKYAYELTDSEFEGEKQAQGILKSGIDNGLQIEGVDSDEARKLLARKLHKTKIGEFGKDVLWGSNIDISIEAMQGLSDSKLVEAQFFDNLLLNGGINNISPELLDLYLQANPNISPRTKASMTQVIENLKQSKIRQLQSEYSELLGKTQQIMAYTKQLEAQSGYQSQYLKNLQSEFSNKINMSNKIIGGLQQDLSKYKETEQSEGEVKSNNARGISGSKAEPQS